MKQIIKSKPPASLVTHSQKENADFDNYQEKQDLRDSLDKEQRGICCYCMGPIASKIDQMKIEHFHCVDNYPKEQLDYGNLLGACKGGEGEPGRLAHCDTFKSNKDLHFIPTAKMYAIEDAITYGNDGTISSNNGGLQRELNEVLNLNTKKLTNRRKATLDGFKDGLSRYKGEIGTVTLERWINDWNGTSHANNLHPYCMIVVYWLRKRLNRA
jgi:uncharacterized protein (TIGR02646 family)